MNAKQKREPKEPLKLPVDFEEALSDLLKVRPPIKEPAVKKPSKTPKKAKS
ncbi:MAG: hypothetical protein JO053_08020 [Acidobacteria bacterium]|nr:hypothetical protein [Acidobacteriota bacterium]